MSNALPSLVPGSLAVAARPARRASVGVVGVVVVGVVVVFVAGCPPPSSEGEGDAGEGEGEARTAFAWEATDKVNAPPLWGSIVSDGDDGEAFVVGGVSGDLGPVVSEIQRVRVDGERLRSTSTLSTDVPRFCGCAMFDRGRRELVVIGGRDDSFLDVNSAFVVNVDTGVRADVADPLPARFPIGCQAFFVDGADRGVVFSGLSASGGEGFGPDTFSWNPEDRTFTVVDVVDGPKPRYDASVHRDGDDGFLMVGGMGGNNLGVTFFSEVWRFSATTSSWTPIAVTSDDTPPGRRYPFAAYNEDHGVLVYGYGSDSPTGDSVLDDLWSFSLASGTWQPLDVEGDAPSARGFAYRLPGPAGSAGVLHAGLGSDVVRKRVTTGAVDGDFVLRAPDDLDGAWR